MNEDFVILEDVEEIEKEEKKVDITELYSTFGMDEWEIIAQFS